MIAYGWEAMLAFFVGGRVGYGLLNWGIWNDNLSDWFLVWQKPGMNYEIGYLALVLITTLIAMKRNWKIWTFFEQITGSLLIFFLVTIGDEFVRTRFDMSQGALILVLIICSGLTSFVKRKYRSFIWYKSGKSGFVWFFINFFFWAVMSVISLLLWNNETVAFIYLLLSLTSFLGLFILGDVLEPLLIFGKGKK